MINLENYRNGLIKGYELAYQDKDWYDKNKNNFCNSIRKNFPELIPEYAKNTDIQNFLAFNPDDLIRFGKLEKVRLNETEFWVAKIPKGMSLYHSSRALALNHSDFPLIGYSNTESIEENYTNSSTICPDKDFLGDNLENVCTYVSYYSTPYLTKGYLRKTTGFGGDAIKYAYGITPFSEDKNNKIYNDRLRYKVDYKKDEIRVSEQTEGVAAYKTKDNTYLFIFGIDDILIDRPNLGKRNLKQFYEIMKKTVNNQKFLDLILSVGGIGSLQDNVDVIRRDYPVASNFEDNVKNWLIRNAKYYSENPLATAGLIKDFPKEISQDFPKNSQDLSKIPGFRFSTYEHDRPVMNMLSWLFKTNSVYNKKGEKIEVSGFVSSSLYVYSKGKGDITKGKVFNVKNLLFYSSRGYFHSELGLFFAPRNLERDRNNKYDTEYSINYLGITQEYRKFKTDNLLPKPNSFHQGHLLEHNTWVGLVASNLYSRFTKYNSNEIASQDVYLLAGYLHDLGKSGECETKAVYANLDHQNPQMSVCKYEFEKNQIIGFRYHTLPAHPEEGYEYLKGYKSYKKFTLQGTNSKEEINKAAQKLSIKDWDGFFDKLGIDEFNKRMIRIAVGAHWYFGDEIRKIVSGKNRREIAEKYLRKIERFYNDEFTNPNLEEFRNIVIFVIIISIADIFGSEYDPTRVLEQNEINTLINYLPNISLNEIDIEKSDTSSKIVTKIILKALNYSNEATHKKKIFENLRVESEKFIDECLSIDFKFNANNNYSLLYNLKKSYVSVSDIQRAYPDYFPKAIVFDLDQTLLASNLYTGEYYIYPDTYKIIDEVQKLRPNTKIVLATRHYTPKNLKKLLQSKIYKEKENPIYYENFDLIVSKYTGPKEKLMEDLKNININTTGFMMDNTGENYDISDNSKFLDIDKISKNGHFDLVKRKFGISYSDIINFDDDRKYFEDGEGLTGEAKNVFVAGVLRSSNVEEQGIRESLFKDGIAFYVFNKLIF